MTPASGPASLGRFSHTNERRSGAPMNSPRASIRKAWHYRVVFRTPARDPAPRVTTRGRASRSRGRTAEEILDRLDGLGPAPVAVHRMVESVHLVDGQHPGPASQVEAAAQPVAEVIDAVVGLFEDEVDGERAPPDATEPTAGGGPNPETIERI